MSIETVWDKAERGFEANIRREARKRCLEELEAFSKGQDIESGVGVDVERAYLMLIQRHEQKDGFASR